MQKESSNVMVDEIGDCFICTPDENNQYCKNYIPINITIIDIKE